MEDFWNKRYAQAKFAYGTSPNNFFKLQLEKLTPGKILMVCEGEGRNAVYAALNNWEVDAFDLSEEGRKKALQLAIENNVKLRYQIQDAGTINYPPNSFDAIVLIFVHLPEEIRASVHKRVMDWLKPNGVVILEAFNPNQLDNASGGPKDESMLYTPKLLQNDFNGLKIVLLSNACIVLDEGQYHVGKADVIRFIGKKEAK